MRATPSLLRWPYKRKRPAIPGRDSLDFVIMYRNVWEGPVSLTIKLTDFKVLGSRLEHSTGPLEASRLEREIAPIALARWSLDFPSKFGIIEQCLASLRWQSSGEVSSKSACSV